MHIIIYIYFFFAIPNYFSNSVFKKVDPPKYKLDSICYQKSSFKLKTENFDFFKIESSEYLIYKKKRTYDCKINTFFVLFRI